MKKKHTLLLTLICLLFLCGCDDATITPEKTPDSTAVTTIQLSDHTILVNGEDISSDTTSAVYQANDIVFYLEGQDFTYGEGTEEESHSQADADKNTVIHITKPGTYSVNGKLSAGQIAIDLGKEAKKDPDAVVNLILDNADITCQVAPGIIFYNVYECGDKDEENATYDVDTTSAGANLILADDSTNIVNGSHVAKIFESVTLNDDKTEILDSKKLHKYDGAVYSKMTMNVYGEEKGNGTLTINADNEGLDTEMHLSIWNGNITINSGNDGINTNEDGISVTTIHDGNLTINVTGTTGEGDGIDSNGWLVINGGTVNAFACGESMDSGIDSDMGIYLNGGTVLASGNMLDRIANEDITYSVFSFIKKVPANTTFTLKDESGNVVTEVTSVNEFSNLIITRPELLPGTYTLWIGNTQYACVKDSGNGNGGFFLPGDKKLPPEIPQNGDFSDVMPPEGETPGKLPFDKDSLGEMHERDDFNLERPEPEDFPMRNIEVATAPEFEITKGANYFSYIEAIN